MKTADADILDALIQALAQQNAPLPPALQQEMSEMGRRLAEHDSQAIDQLHHLISQYPPLQTAYDNAYRNILKTYQSQERTKSLSGAIATSWTPDLEISAVQALTAENPIAMAKRLLSQQETESHSNTNQEQRARSVLVMIVGGTSIGSMIAQVPGAIVGGVLGGVFGWLYPNKASYNKN